MSRRAALAPPPAPPARRRRMPWLGVAAVALIGFVAFVYAPRVAPAGNGHWQCKYAHVTCAKTPAKPIHKPVTHRTPERQP